MSTSPSRSIRPVELTVPDQSGLWQEAGFIIQNNILQLPGLKIRFTGSCDAGGGSGSASEKNAAVSIGWAVTGDGRKAEVWDLDGIQCYLCEASAGGDDAQSHRNCVSGVDHIVIRSPDWRRIEAAFAAFGLLPRHRTNSVRRGLVQLFYRSQDQPSPIIEVVAPSEVSTNGNSELWGITFVSADIDRTHEALRDRTKPPWPAVQRGRRITTLRNNSASKLCMAVAFMSPHVKDDTPKEQRESPLGSNSYAQEQELAQRKGGAKL